VVEAIEEKNKLNMDCFAALAMTSFAIDMDSFISFSFRSFFFIAH
jgi:hypothetical protein